MWFDSHNPGSITVENNHKRIHDITLAIPDGPEKTLTVASNEKEVDKEFISDPGTYNIQVYIDSNLHDVIDGYEIQKYSNGNITGGEIHVTINKFNEISWEIYYSN